MSRWPARVCGDHTHADPSRLTVGCSACIRLRDCDQFLAEIADLDVAGVAEALVDAEEEVHLSQFDETDPGCVFRRWKVAACRLELSRLRAATETLISPLELSRLRAATETLAG